MVDSSKAAIAKNAYKWKNNAAYIQSTPDGRTSFARNYESTQYDTLFLKQHTQFAEQRGIDVVVVDLNECDSAQLEKLPRIGPFTARKIIQYRSRLGGYLSVLQLKEIKGLDTSILHEPQIHWKVNLSKINTLSCSRFDIAKWYKHPYIGKEKAKIIQNYIKMHSPMTEIKWFKMKALGDYEKTIIHPYILFD